ncbi:MAG: RIP metalloprotease RseP [bacterium]
MLFCFVEKMLSTIIIFILILSLLVFVHELGHFAAAKKMGVKVEEFGIGFPPKAFGVKKGETTYSLNWIPIGGFVKLKGENGEDKNDKDSFASKAIWKKFIILASGVGMNFILAIIIIGIGYGIGFPQVIEGQMDKYAEVSDQKIQVTDILEGLPADKSGMLSGDIVLAVDGKKVTSPDDVNKYINSRKEEKIILEIGREDEVIQKEVMPVRSSLEETEGYIVEDEYIIGVGLIEVGVVKYPFYIAAVKGVEQTASWTKEIILALYGVVRNLVSGQKAGVEIAGPVGIAALTGKVADLGFIYVLQFIALLTINLGIINLLPFPALDGGRILVLFIEKIRGKAVDEKIENLIHNVGFALLMVLIVVVTYKDIVTYKSAFIDFFSKIF